MHPGTPQHGHRREHGGGRRTAAAALPADLHIRPGARRPGLMDLSAARDLGRAGGRAMTAVTVFGPRRYQARYPARAESVPRARHAVARALTSWGLEALTEAAESVVSELVANAVTHTDTAVVGVSVTRLGATRVRLVVTDTSPRRPHAAGAPSEDDEHGRGLLIVAALAVRWGAGRLRGGKRMWAELEASR